MVSDTNYKDLWSHFITFSNSLAVCLLQSNLGGLTLSRTTQNTVCRNCRTTKHGSRLDQISYFSTANSVFNPMYFVIDSQLLCSTLASLHRWPARANSGNDPGHAQSRVLHFQICCPQQGHWYKRREIWEVQGHHESRG
jgi:hypothetical protein